MYSRILGAALILLLLAGAAVGVARSAGDRSPDPAAPVAPADHPGTLMLTVEIDHRGVRVIQATAKPSLRFRAPRHESEMEFRWTLRDAEGRALADSGFDPDRICLDPTHEGQPPHLDGDWQIPHLTHVNVKVPDLRATATIEFAHRIDGALTPFGTARRDTLPIR